MEKMIYSQIASKDYLGIVTILDYEVSLHKCLSNIRICLQNRIQRKIIVDLALKVGMNEYRFVMYDVTDDGIILWNTSKYITPCEDIIRIANSIIKQKSNILSNSMLPNTTQNLLQKS